MNRCYSTEPVDGGIQCEIGDMKQNETGMKQEIKHTMTILDQLSAASFQYHSEKQQAIFVLLHRTEFLLCVTKKEYGDNKKLADNSRLI